MVYVFGKADQYIYIAIGPEIIPQDGAEEGHLLDLLGRRDQAIERYKKALEQSADRTMRHDQYQMAINRAWVQKRLEEPFRRE